MKDMLECTLKACGTVVLCVGNYTPKSAAFPGICNFMKNSGKDCGVVPCVGNDFLKDITLQVICNFTKGNIKDHSVVVCVTRDSLIWKVLKDMLERTLKACGTFVLFVKRDLKVN